MKPFSEACERNREPILSVLKRVFSDRTRVLEIGSGTGQHAAYFAPALPHLVWQPADVAEHLAGIAQWVTEAGAPNLRMPLELDVDRAWPDTGADAGFSANTSHIMSWPQLRGRDPQSGLRDIEAILALGEREYLKKAEDIAMPANNRLLVFRRAES